MRLFLDGAEVWQGLTFLGVISADWLARQVRDRLDQVALGEWLRAELAADPTRRLSPPVAPEPPALPSGPISRAVKAERRAQRRKNKGTRRAS